MVLTSDDKKNLLVYLNTTDKKEAVKRMVASALMEGSNISAPEMRRTLQIVETLLNPDELREQQSYKNQAV